MIKSRHILFINIISAIFILLFTYTAINKFLKIEAFKIVLGKSPLIGSWASLTAWCIVLLEWVAVLLLLYPPIRLAGFFLSLMLMVIFTAYILIMLLSSSHLPCSCGGVLKELSWKNHLYLNIFLTGLAALGLRLEFKRRKQLILLKQG